jgi:predicted SAM-dependent methyltransferase
MDTAPAQLAAGAVLHVGCGSSPLPDWVKGEETRLDIDGRCNPDIIASMTDLGDIGEYDLVYCSHALEHLYPHDALKALREFYRVLKPNGMAWITVPNLTGIEPTFDVVYETDAGRPITGFHMFYGDLYAIEEFPHMAHRAGYVPETLRQIMEIAGFKVAIAEHSGFNLTGIGMK